MSVLLFAEQSQGKFKKAVFEAATLAKDLAGDAPLAAVVIGPADADELNKLGQYGVSTVHHIAGMENFSDRGYTGAVDAAATAAGANAIVMAQTYTSKSIAPRLAIRGDAALLSGAYLRTYRKRFRILRSEIGKFG